MLHVIFVSCCIKHMVLQVTLFFRTVFTLGDEGLHREHPVVPELFLLLVEWGKVTPGQKNVRFVGQKNRKPTTVLSF